ncbi:MAG: metal-dependent hydrolase [Stagnimonas sp.]|nr:metal-dependent hydrolase [Stagnimonas sp.]
MSILPIRRDIRFSLAAERISDWHPRGQVTTQFINTLSLFFPVGERFFIQAVRHYRDQVSDPELQKAMTAFIGQEAMHGREHEEYNDLMQQAGLPAVALENRVKALLERIKAVAPPSTQLAITIALEHYTALLADWVLSVDAVTRDTEPGYQALWRWHSLEETEHKAVAYDVWNAVMKDRPRAYAERAAVQLIATGLFMALVSVYTVRMVRADRKARGLKQWRSLAGFLVGREGFLRRSFRPWLDYFKPGFHPWQHDNRHFLAEIEDFVRGQQALSAAA